MVRKTLKILAWIVVAAIIVLSIQAWHEISTLHQMTDKSFTAFRISSAGSTDLPAESGAAAAYLQKGDWHFEKGEYDLAIQNYRLLQQTTGAARHLLQVAEWHECLALYHNSGPSDPSFRQLLDNIARNRQHQYQHKALDLRDQLDHFIVALLKG